MLRTTILLGLAIVTLVALVQDAFAVNAPAPPSAQIDSGDARFEREAVRARWEAMDAKKRERVRRLARRLQSLPPERRARLLERLRAMTPKETRRLGRRMESFLAKDDAERTKLRTRARRFRLLERHLPPTTRRELREASAPERKRLLQKHSRRLLHAFQRSMEPSERQRFRQATRQQRSQKFERYLARSAPEFRRPSGDRDAPRMRDQQRRMQRVRAKLSRLTPDERFRLLRDADDPGVEVDDRLRRELREMTPRQRQMMRRNFLRKKRGRE